MNDRFVDAVNRASVKIAFVAIAVGVLAATIAVWLPDTGPRALVLRVVWSAIIIFLGAGAAMCTVKYFYTNREKGKE